MNESVTFRSPFMGIHHLESLPFGKWERFIFTTTVHQAKERVFFLKKLALTLHTLSAHFSEHDCAHLL